MRVRTESGSSQALVRAFVALWLLSTGFPIVASTVRLDRPPTATGIADVVLALVVGALGLTISTREPGPFDDDVVRSAFELYRLGAALCLGLLVVFFLIGHRLQWDVLLIGLAWRVWLAAWVLPSALMIWRRQSPRTSLRR